MNAPSAALHESVSHGGARGRRLAAHPCPECGGPVQLRGPGQIFCAPSCKKAHHYREGIRGRQLMMYAMAARQTRNGSRGNQEVGAHASTRMNQLMADWKAEDTAAGQMDAVELAALRQRKNHDW